MERLSVTSACSFIFVWFLCLDATVLGKAEIQEVCATESFTADCPSGHVIVMQSALYGRMRIGRCVPTNYGNVGCATDVLTYFDGVCSGQQSCNIPTPNAELFTLNTNCPRDFTPYLEASYQCQPVFSSIMTEHSCNADGVVKVSHSTRGFLASSVAQSSKCPWRIEAEPGQRINITLLDFGPEEPSPDTHRSGAYQRDCHKYAVLKETPQTDIDVARDVFVCRGSERKRQVYQTKSNQLNIDWTTTEHQPNNFLLQYSVVGCPKLELKGNILLQQSDNEAVIKCEKKGKISTINCHEGRWIEEVDECEQESPSWSGALDGSGPSALLVTIGIGVAVGTLVGCVLLSIVVMYFRRRRKERATKHLNMSMQYNSSNYPKYIPKDYQADQKYYQYDTGTPAQGEFLHVWNPEKNEVTLMRNPDIHKNYYKESLMQAAERNTYADDHIYEGLD